MIAAPLALTSSPTQAVTGPAATGAALSFTARLDIGDGQRACSAALIAPQWLATAASCFADDPNTEQVTPGAPKWKTTATIGSPDLATTSGQTREVVELVPREGRDIVMARLAQPTAGIDPVPFATTAPTAGQELTVAGFGRTKVEWAPTKLHTATFAIDAIADTTLAVHGKTTEDAICAGDTGGPVVRSKADGGYELVAVASKSWQGGCLNSEETRNDAVTARVDNVVAGNKITAGTTLVPGDTLVSNSARLAMQTDGNLTVTSNAGKTIWQTGTGSNPGAVATFTADGNLTVTSADGATTLWESKTSAAGGELRLQNRGNLVVYTSQGTSLWSSGTAIRHDYTGDGRSDLASWYDYDDGRDRIHVSAGDTAGLLATPKDSYTGAAGTWDTALMKRTTGDFNGDGIGDVAALAKRTTEDTLRLWMWTGKGDGTFNAPVEGWNSGGGWSLSNIQVQAGDFNGDGRDDVAAWYDYADGSDKLYTFLSGTSGSFAAPFASFTRATGQWTAANAKYTTGDFNGDGRDDLGIFYGYTDGNSKIFTFTAGADGGFAEPVSRWENAQWGSLAQTTVHSGDFDGDGHDDIVTWYDYTDGHDGVLTFHPSGVDGAFDKPETIWSADSGRFWRDHMKIVTGDYNGDGRDDFGAFYGYDDGAVKAFTWTAKPDGTLNEPAAGWSVPAGQWSFSRTTTIERYSPA